MIFCVRITPWMLGTHPGLLQFGFLNTFSALLHRSTTCTCQRAPRRIERTSTISHSSAPRLACIQHLLHRDARSPCETALLSRGEPSKVFSHQAKLSPRGKIWLAEATAKPCLFAMFARHVLFILRRRNKVAQHGFILEVKTQNQGTLT